MIQVIGRSWVLNPDDITDIYIWEANRARTAQLSGWGKPILGDDLTMDTVPNKYCCFLDLKKNSGVLLPITYVDTFIARNRKYISLSKDVEMFYLSFTRGVPRRSRHLTKWRWSDSCSRYGRVIKAAQIFTHFIGLHTILADYLFICLFSPLKTVSR